MDVGGGAVHLELFQSPLEFSSLCLLPVGLKNVSVHFFHGTLEIRSRAVLLLEELVPFAALPGRGMGLYLRCLATRLIRSALAHVLVETGVPVPCVGLGDRRIKLVQAGLRCYILKYRVDKSLCTGGNVSSEKKKFALSLRTVSVA